VVDPREKADTVAQSEAPPDSASHVRPRTTGAPPPEADDLPPGAAVGEYVIEALIGRGGMGSVYAARQPLIGKRVAIKVLSTDLPEDATALRRFVDEARAVNKIGHPNIIDIFSFGELPDKRQYFVMELLQGFTLRDRMEDRPLELAECQRYLEHICSALSAAHAEQIVHRDLKPENIWISTPKHGEPYVKLLDFGIAKLLETHAVGPATQTGVAMGTPQFMSPEQCRGVDVDYRTDIYALGIILYEIFAGRLPFIGNSLIEVLMQHMTTPPPPPSGFRAVPSAIERLILACLEKEPSARPQSAAEVLLRFREAVLAPAAPEPDGATDRVPRRIADSGLETLVTDRGAGRKARLLALAVLALAVVLGALWFAKRSLRAPDDQAIPVHQVAPRELRAADTPPPPATAAPEAVPELAPANPPVAPPTQAPAPAPIAAPPRASEPAHAAPVRRESEGKRSTRVEKQGLVTDNPFQ
jgi:serine/threonine-protein kinase